MNLGVHLNVVQEWEFDSRLLVSMNKWWRDGLSSATGNLQELLKRRKKKRIWIRLPLDLFIWQRTNIALVQVGELWKSGEILLKAAFDNMRMGAGGLLAHLGE